MISQISRNATIRAITPVTLGCIAPEKFHLWRNFRTFLLMRAVPLIRTLPDSEQFEMYDLLQHQDFADGEYIMKQGDIGDKFYIITDGAADVIDETIVNHKKQRNVLTRLYEGHFFGELALIYDEPRLASVQAVGPTNCLYLSKAAFRAALTAQQFNDVMQEISYQRMITRERREEQIQKSTLLQSEYSISSGISSLTSMTGDLENDYADRLPDKSLTLGHTSSTVTSTLVRRRFSSGDRFINKYNIIQVIGHGTFGDVYSARNEEDDSLVAIKSVNRYF
jgi:CRP-like cAMP-binding protein